MSASHAAVKQELLVRHLDAWTPAVLHGHKRVIYLEAYADACPAGAGCADAGPAADPGSDAGTSAIAAAQVFGEFADLLERHTLTMLLLGADSAALDTVAGRVADATESLPGLVVCTVTGPLRQTLASAGRSARGTPMFGWFDAYASSPPPASDVSAVVGHKSSEVLLALPPSLASTAYVESLAAAGLRFHCHVELVDPAGVAQLIIFATSSENHLEKFKDELWALDEYAGIRLRDPLDEERTLLDISVRPQLGPLRRALAHHLANKGGATVAELRSWAVHETIYRAEDATRAVQAMVTGGAATREPAGGRLSPTTMIRLRPGQPASTA